MKINVSLLYTEGTNCNLETENAFRKVGASVETKILSEIIRNNENFDKSHIIVIPGGFSYGDDISAGKVFADLLMHYERDNINRFLNNGKLIIGICNGFQVLVKSGLLPNIDGNENVEVTLDFNDSGIFINKWVNLKVNNNSVSKFINHNFPDTIELPIAHAEGKFVANKRIIKSLNENRQIVFQYCDKDGNITDKSNPNGSYSNIAGICDISGQILGLMPHPERYVEIYQYPSWQRKQFSSDSMGTLIFNNAIKYVKENL